MNGTVIRVFLSKGFGFVRGDEDGTSRFMHVSDLQPIQAFDHLREGQRVTFTPIDGQHGGENRGPRAIDVHIIGA